MITLIRKLKQKSSPPWSFVQFMETALYDKEVGYYMKEQSKLGKDGDFYTSNHVHPVFSQTFARSILDIVIKENLPLAICEFGAGDGSFAKQALAYFEEKDVQMFQSLTYVIVESSGFHRTILKDKLKGYNDKVKIYASFDKMVVDFPSFEGIIFSNEFLDAMPVHLIEQGETSLLEISVDVGKEGTLVERLSVCENQQLIDWVDHFGPQLPAHYRSEVCLQMAGWIKEIAKWLTRGAIITVDYGYCNDELMLPERREGSIRGYKNHSMVKDPLKFPGEMDLTAHVQWDAFRKVGKEEGLSEVLHERQDKYLIQAGLFSFLALQDNDNSPFSQAFKRNRAIQSFVHPEGISSAFQVNIQGKELDKVKSYALFNEDPYQISEK